VLPLLFSLTLIQKLCEGYRYVCMCQFISMFQIFFFPFYNVRFYIKWNILLVICNQTSNRNHCTYSILSLTARWLFQSNIIIDLKWKTKTVGTIPKSNIKTVERGKIDILNTQIKQQSIIRFPKLKSSDSSILYCKSLWVFFALNRFCTYFVFFIVNLYCCCR
jgi:hypothetical protein